MTASTFRRRLLATSVMVGAALAATPAMAQQSQSGSADTPNSPQTAPVEATPPAQQSAGATTNGQSATAEAQGDVIVTGSRIPQPNLTSTAPVTVLGAADIKLQGTTRVEDLLNSLPQVFAGQASTLSNGASGTATVNLRGLGSTRTLVLVNGRRLLPGDPGSSAADLNAIPDGLVKRVEVLTGGASSTYGADAVAGVVNFIMDTGFTGLQIDTQYSFYNNDNHNNVLRAANNARTAAGAPGYGYPDGPVADGGTINTTLTFGVGDDRAHLTGYVGYRQVNPVLQSNRDYSSCTVQGSGFPRPPAAQVRNGNIVCGGSATSAEGNFLDSTSNSYHVGAGRTFVPGLTRYNFSPTNYYQRPDERYTAGLFAHYDINDSIKPYMEFMFMDDRTQAQIAPSGDFGNTLTINCDNPLLSAQQRGVVCRPDNLVNGFIGTYPLTANTNSVAAAPVNFIDPTTGATYNRGYLQLLRRNVEGGPRNNDLQHTEYRTVLGTKGDLGKAFSYDAYYQYGRTNFSSTYTGEFSTRRLTNSLDVVAGPNGTPICRSVRAGTDVNCVPYNFETLGGVTPAAVAYNSAVGLQRGVVSEQVVNASITGRLGQYGIAFPWADEGLSFNIGGEYRKERLQLVTDQEFSTGDLTGQGAPTLPITGSFKVTEGFAEAQLPIVHNAFFADLSVNGGYRRSHYKLSNGNTFDTNTYKLGADFAPISDIRFRGSYNRAVRAPNLQELFATQFVGLDGGSDPCAGAAPSASQAACALQGVTAAQYGRVAPNPAAQYNGLLGGNPNLNPEKATTKTVGVVIQPRFLRRLALTVDYYDIQVKNAVQSFGADQILASCVSTGAPGVCGLIHRNPAGSLWLTPDGYVQDLPANIGSFSTKGVDFNAAYSMQVGALGNLALSTVGTYLKSLRTDNGLTQAYNCATYYGLTCGTPNPRWRAKTRATFTLPDGVGFSAQWRYFGPVYVDFSSNNPSLSTNGNYSNFGSRIGSQSYFDLSSTIRVADQFTFRIGVNNILDRNPPLINSNGAASACPGTVCSGNTFPAVYDALGRYIFTGVTLTF